MKYDILCKISAYFHVTTKKGLRQTVRENKRGADEMASEHNQLETCMAILENDFNVGAAVAQ